MTATKTGNCYAITIRLLGYVEADSYKEAEEKINKHLNDIGDVKSDYLALHWSDAEWDIEDDNK